MSSLEYYSDSWENKSAPEYKEFKAELYEKKNEYFSGAPEVKRFDVESFDHSPINKKSEDEDKKKKISQVKQKEKTRTRLQKILDNVSKTATKVATTVVGVAAVGVGAVISLSPLFSPSKPTPIDVSLNDFVVGGNYAAYELEISELSPDIDYDIVISDGKDEFINEEVLNGTNSELVVGLDTDTKYTLSVVSEENGERAVHYEKAFKTNGTQIIHDEYQAVFKEPQFNDVTIEWLSEENKFTIPIHFESHSDPNYRYRVSLLDENQGVISSYIGAESNVSLSAPSSCERAFILYEPIYYADGFEYSYSSKRSPEFYLAPPEIILGDKQLSEPNSYRINYKISTELHNELYSDIFFIANGEDAGQGYIWKINEYNSHFVSFSEPTLEFDLEATVTYEAPYGGNLRTVTAKRSYKNELEFTDKAYYSFEYGEAVFSFNYSNADGYVLLRNESSATEEKLAFGTYYYSLSSQTAYTYALYSGDDQRLSEEKTVSFTPLDTKPSYDFNYLNPSDLLITYNDDGTINIYNDTKFSCDDPNVYYEIYYRSVSHEYVCESRRPFVGCENLEYGSYSVEYRIIYSDESGAKYELQRIVPSGDVHPSINSYVRLNIPNSSTVIFEFNDLIYNGDIIATVDGKEYVFTGDDIKPSEHSDNILPYCYIITVDELIGSEQMLNISARYNSYTQNTMLESYENEIKGSPFATQTLYFGG
ncbi:MAG: hypothetical protein IKC16_06795 [Clostridia bacterium]|nr:hypothetical protein [Clostridia bacterium]